MQNRKRDTNVQNRLLDSVGEGDGGMFWENSIEQVYYQGWNRSPAHVGYMRQVLRAGALGRPRGMGWGGRWEGWLGWGTHVNPWLIHIDVWQKPLQYCKVISLQLIKINEKNRNKKIKVKKLIKQWETVRKQYRKLRKWLKIHKKCCVCNLENYIHSESA